VRQVIQLQQQFVAPSLIRLPVHSLGLLQQGLHLFPLWLLALVVGHGLPGAVGAVAVLWHI
jgi:hypothetical protein